jgi:CRP-like cAMP-binding protein
MAKAKSLPTTPGNRLLARLPPAEYRKLLPDLKPVTLESGQVLHKARAPVEYVYFPTRCVTSFLTVMEDGAAIEVGTVGPEGVVGVTAALGAPRSSHQVIVQVPGEGLRMGADVLAAEAARDGALRRLLTLYQAAFLSQVLQSVACNGLHPIGRRCCRWLLITHDRVGSDELPLTHEFLGMMLGVRRASVTGALGPLRDKGLIRYARGVITVLDRKGLEAAACECYRAVADEFDRLFE